MPRCDLETKLLVSAVGMGQRLEFSVSSSVVPPMVSASRSSIDFPTVLVGEKTV